ncbi:hypothetical protein [Caenispirillum salinarum]|uniref:hypothetical protein n=1 Tax=Caenispirillum salinarum TaxID=859058 RepID=UPI00384D1EBA
MRSLRRSFRPRRMAAAVAVAALLTAAAGANPAAASSCADRDEAAALHVRSLQTWMVVASLTCGSVDAYNDFVLKFRPALQRHGDALIGYFQRTYGGQGTSKLNRYVTLLANQASALSLKDRGSYCTRTAEMYDEMQDGVSLTQLESYSAENVGLLAVEPKSCMSENLVVSLK